MNERPPYFEWPIDSWKLLVLAILFLLLLLGALWWPSDALALTELNPPQAGGLLGAYSTRRLPVRVPACRAAAQAWRTQTG